MTIRDKVSDDTGPNSSWAFSPPYLDSVEAIISWPRGQQPNVDRATAVVSAAQTMVNKVAQGKAMADGNTAYISARDEYASAVAAADAALMAATQAQTAAASLVAALSQLSQAAAAARNAILAMPEHQNFVAALNAYLANPVGRLMGDAGTMVTAKEVFDAALDVAWRAADRLSSPVLATKAAAEVTANALSQALSTADAAAAQASAAELAASAALAAARKDEMERARREREAARGGHR